MPTSQGKHEIRRGRMLTMPRRENDGSINFFGPPPPGRRARLAPQGNVIGGGGFGAIVPWGPQVVAQPGPPQPLVRTTSVGVMNVGQGNCNMLIDQDHPVAYYDTGLPLWFYSETAPEPLRENVPGTPSGPITQNATNNLRVVLSHWDWDHWYLARRWPALQQLPWTVPEQAMGARAHNFFNNLPILPTVIPAGNQALEFPAGSPYYRICRCHPIPALPAAAFLNNTGLAVVARATLPANVVSYVLLTGDANHSSLPPGWRGMTSVAGITAVHHGSNAHGAPEQLVPPRANLVQGGRIAYTYGLTEGKYHPYGFPAPAAVESYQQAGWGAGQSENSTPQGSNINEDQLLAQRGNIRMGDQTELNQQYNNTAFFEFPAANRLT